MRRRVVGKFPGTATTIGPVGKGHIEEKKLCAQASRRWSFSAQGLGQLGAHGRLFEDTDPPGENQGGWWFALRAAIGNMLFAKESTGLDGSHGDQQQAKETKSRARLPVVRWSLGYRGSWSVGGRSMLLNCLSPWELLLRFGDAVLI